MRRNDRPEAWVLTVGEGGGSLWRGGFTAHGTPHLDRLDGIANRWREPDQSHERHRPSPLAAKDGHTHAAPTREAETFRRRFAKDLVRWLDRIVDHRGIPRLHVFGPARLLREVHRCARPTLIDRLDAHEANLSSLPPGELALHPAVSAVLRSNGR